MTWRSVIVLVHVLQQSRYHFSHEFPSLEHPGLSLTSHSPSIIFAFPSPLPTEVSSSLFEFFALRTPSCTSLPGIYTSILCLTTVACLQVGQRPERTGMRALPYPSVPVEYLL